MEKRFLNEKGVREKRFLIEKGMSGEDGEEGFDHGGSTFFEWKKGKIQILWLFGFNYFLKKNQ